MAHITQKLSQKQKYVQQPTRSSESVEKFMLVQISCIDVAAIGRSRVSNRASVLNFVAIDPTDAEIGRFFSERELTFKFAICYSPSVCRLSSVCNVRAPYSGG